MGASGTVKGRDAWGKSERRRKKGGGDTGGRSVKERHIFGHCHYHCSSHQYLFTQRVHLIQSQQCVGNFLALNLYV